MTPFEKLEFFAENTNNISELRNLLIEVLHNNKIDYNAAYLDHKKAIDNCLQKDINL